MLVKVRVNEILDKMLFEDTNCRDTTSAFIQNMSSICKSFPWMNDFVL